MSWYKCNAPHDRMERGGVYWLEDDAYTAARVDKGRLEPADEPEWNRQLPEGQQWPRMEE